MPHYFYNQEVQSFTFANQPPASSNKGVIIYLSDIGVNGSHWISNGTVWNAVNHEYNLKSTQTAINSAGTASEEILEQVSIPAGLLKSGDILEYDVFLVKSNTSDTTTQRTRFGPLGTTADPILLALGQPATTNLAVRVVESWIVMGTNTLRHVSTQGAQSYGTSATAQPDIAVNTLVDNIMSLGVVMTTGGLATNTLIKWILRHKTTRVS